MHTSVRDAAAALLRATDNDQQAAIAAIQAMRHTPDRLPEKAIPKTPILVDVTNLTKTYKVGRQSVEALRGVTLSVHEGEFIALTGTSGSGKSTLLQLIGGLDKPTTGSVAIANTDITKLSDHALSRFRNRTIGFVFQFFYLQPFLHLDTNLEIPAMFARTATKDRHERMYELAEAVGLSDRLAHFPKELSGGQMQRAAIARALLNRPKLLLADEPTGNLDSANSKAIMELFETIRMQYGTTIIMVTHDQTIANQADRTIRLKDGEIVE